MVEKRDNQKSGKNQNSVPPRFNRRETNQAVKEKEHEAKLEAIAEQFLKADKTGIELDVERGRLLKQAREVLKQHQSWIRWHKERLGLDPQSVNKLIRRADAAERYGINKIFKLGKSVFDILVAPEAPDGAIQEGIERSKKERLTCAHARLLVREIKDAQGQQQRRGRKPKEPAPEVTLKNTPTAVARHLATYPPEQISEIAERAHAKALKDNPLRRNASFMLEAVKWVKPVLPDKASVALGTAYSRFLVRNGTISASNGGLIATTAFPYEGSFRVDARSFENELNYGTGIPDIRSSDAHVTIIQSDGSKAHLTNLPKADQEEDRQPNGKLYSLSSKPWAALADLRKLTTDVFIPPLLPGIWVKNGNALVASGPFTGCVENIGINVDFHIAVNAADFILSKKVRPIELLVEPDWIWFLWPDGSALGSRQINTDEATKKLNGLFNTFNDWSVPKWTIEEEWRSAFRRVSRVGTDILRLYSDHMSVIVDNSFGKKGTDTYAVSVAITTPLPKSLNGKYIDIPIEILSPVVDVAEAIDFPAYPDKISFKAREILGFVILKRPNPSDNPK